MDFRVQRTELFEIAAECLGLTAQTGFQSGYRFLDLG
jgi:hypothetical protein